MDTKAHYTLVGLIVVGLVIALITGIVWVSIGLDRPTYNIYMTYMDQSITGLNTEAPVKYNGVNVGYVKNTELNPTNPQEVIVTLNIKAGTPITTSTVATLAPQGITGLVFVSLSAKTPNAPLVKPRSSPPYPVIPSEPSLLVQLSSLFKDTSTQIAAISGSVQNVLDAQNAANIKQILINLNKITAGLASDTNSFNEILQNSQVVLQNTAVASKQLPQLMTEANVSMRNLNQATSIAKTALIPLARLISQLNVIAGNIESFSADIKQNPAILIRGKAVTNLGPGE